MRRRRFIPLRPIRRAMVPDIPPALLRANELMAGGNYAAAAAAFENLARMAEARSGPRTPQLYLRAGQARLLAGQVEQGMSHLKHGLSLMAAAGQWSLLQRAGQRVVSELTEQGLAKEAGEITAYLETSLPEEAAAAPGVPAGANRKSLPTHCPGCGGPIRPGEVEWLDEMTAECNYCGSPLRTG